MGGSQKIPTREYRWVILILTYICMLGFAFVFQSLPPILTLVVKELKLTHAQAGLLMSLFALPTIFLSIPGGILSDYYGIRKIGMVSLGLMIVGTLLVIVFIILMNTLVIPEERFEKYGDAYREYLNRTPRWIGIPKSEKKD